MSSGYCLSLILSSQWSTLYSYLALSVLKWDFLPLPTQFLPEAQSTLLSQDTISNCAFSAATGTPPPAWPLVTILRGLLGFCCGRFWTTGILKLASPKAFFPPCRARLEFQKVPNVGLVLLGKCVRFVF